MDFLSLDVDGSELDILNTIPFQRVDIRAVAVDMKNSSREQITKLLDANGYKKAEELNNGMIFVQNKNK